MKFLNAVFDNLQSEMLSDENVFAMAENFKALADPTRLKILILLYQGERGVGELSENLEVTQSAVSHQLRVLRGLNIVRYRKTGREVYYDLADEHVRDILNRSFEHILHD